MKIVKSLLLIPILFSSLTVSFAFAEESPLAKDLGASQVVKAPVATGDEQVSLSDINLQLSGVFRMWSFMPIKPSTEEYQLKFKVPQIDFIIDLTHVDNVGGHLELAIGPTRDATSGQMDIMLAMAYVEFTKVFGTEMAVRYGLIPNTWVLNQLTMVDLEYATRTAKNFLNRYGYSDVSDQGVSIQEDGEVLGWSFAVVNGEGEKSDEQGHGKEARAFVRWSPLSEWRSAEKHFSVMAQVTRGSYEGISPETAKSRYQIMACLDQDVSWGGQAELFFGEDPVDAVTALGIADGVDLSDRGGELAKSFGYSAKVFYSWRDAVKNHRKYQAFARHDFLDPMQAADQRALQADLLGFSYFPRRNLQFSLALGQVDYQGNHSAIVNDSQEINFATSLNF